MKKLLVLLLCLSLTGLPACGALSRNYLYTPSVVKRGTTTEGAIAISDAHILSFADDVKLSWQKRTQIARGIEMGAEGAEAGLGALSGLASVLSFVFPVMGVVSIVSSLISKLVGVVGTPAREGAYLDGIKLIDDAVAEYYVSQNQGDNMIPGDKRTAPGNTLLQKVNNAINKVEAVLSGRVPVETPLAVSSLPASLKGIYTIDPVSKK